MSLNVHGRADRRRHQLPHSNVEFTVHNSYKVTCSKLWNTWSDSPTIIGGRRGMEGMRMRWIIIIINLLDFVAVVPDLLCGKGTHTRRKSIQLTVTNICNASHASDSGHHFFLPFDTIFLIGSNENGCLRWRKNSHINQWMQWILK